MNKPVAQEPRNPLSLFYSYSHKDEDLRNKLQEHLAILRRKQWIAEWHDRNIDVGDEWAKAIDHNLAVADIVLLLVSASFIDSEFCWGVELQKALQRHEGGEARVIPVILRPCRWRDTPFAKLQAAPTDAKPVTTWPDQDAALDDVASKIERIVAELRSKRAVAASVTVNSETMAVPAASVLAPPEDVEKVIRTSAMDADSGCRNVITDMAVFRDVDALWCPEMVALPKGSFFMGSPWSDTEGYTFERPQHQVTINYRFAIGRYPVTFQEYDHFCSLTNRRKPEDQAWGRGRRPVIDVSWRDAQDYVGWLAEATAKPYRLPTEAEWEYAARAGTITSYAFGDEITPKNANYGSNIGRTTEVGLYPPNSWGLLDMHGNVWEWVQDVWHETYNEAPADGSAWRAGKGHFSSNCRATRGGSWYYEPRNLRSSFRSGFEPYYRSDELGFRVARILS